MKCKSDVHNRIKRAHGQMNGVIKLVESEATCDEIITQLKAVKSSIEKVIGLITATNLIEKIEANNQIEIKGYEEALALLLKSI